MEDVYGFQKTIMRNIEEKLGVVSRLECGRTERENVHAAAVEECVNDSNVERREFADSSQQMVLIAVACSFMIPKIVLRLDCCEYWLVVEAHDLFQVRSARSVGTEGLMPGDPTSTLYTLPELFLPHERESILGRCQQLRKGRDMRRRREQLDCNLGCR